MLLAAALALAMALPCPALADGGSGPSGQSPAYGPPPEPPSALTRLIRRLPTPRFLQERKKAKPAPAAAVIPMAPEKARIKVSRTTRSGG